MSTVNPVHNPLPVLAVARGRNPSQRWCIYHGPSGLIAVRGYRSKAAATRELAYFEALIDWSAIDTDEHGGWTLSALSAQDRSRMLDEQARVLHGRPVPERAP